MKKLELSVFLGLILSLILSLFFQTNLTASAVRSQTLRLHIIANSNSEFDQDIKLLVRDEILVLSNDILASSDDINVAISTANENIDKITLAINEYLKEKGVSYTATVSVEDFYFETTSYDGFTLPKGEYPALTVRLGNASGNNWWCVVYPSVCISSASEKSAYKNEEITDFINEDDIKIKFKAVEIFEDIKEFLSGEENIVYDKI